MKTTTPATNHQLPTTDQHMYLVKTPDFIQNNFPGFVWRKPNAANKIFLTFDDGPIPVVTPWVLDRLEQFGAKATFFCVGENAEKYPAVFEQVRTAGHSIGSHTMQHLNGWNTRTETYVKNARDCAALVDSKLFRPPYGRLRPRQAKALRADYDIIMWDVLSGDFDPTISGEDCLQNVIENTEAGSVIVFHDSIKAFPRLQYVLPRVLEFYAERGFEFAGLEAEKRVVLS